MLTISAAEMKAMDSYAIKKVGIPSIVLMESAALKVVENIDLKKKNSFTVICSTGNNGGDGLAIARRLILADKKVELFLLADPEKGTEDFKINLEILKNMGINYRLYSEADFSIHLKKALMKNDLSIDAIFGIGLNREVEGLYKESIQLINQYAKETLAVDTPSGIDADTGKVFGLAVKADQTISFHLMKKGLLKNKEYSGATIVADIGIPKFVTRLILDK